MQSPAVISIHALREEGDALHSYCRTGFRNFYPRPPRGGRLHWNRPGRTNQSISIHALREEGDFSALRLARHAGQFLSTPSARRATLVVGHLVHGGVFLSTPSARRATCCSLRSASADADFYPRPPRGGRPGGQHGRANTQTFLSTPSARRATYRRRCTALPLGYFYPRPPRGGRPWPFLPSRTPPGFLSTPSARRATGCPLYFFGC